MNFRWFVEYNLKKLLLVYENAIGFKMKVLGRVCLE